MSGGGDGGDPLQDRLGGAGSWSPGFRGGRGRTRGLCGLMGEAEVRGLLPTWEASGVSGVSEQMGQAEHGK